MEVFLGLVYIALVVLNVIFFIKVWKMTGHVKSIKTIVEKDENIYNARSEFNKYLMLDDFKSAKEVLLDEICYTKEFQEIQKGGNPTYIKSLMEKLDDRYSKELDRLGVKIDWQRILIYE